MNGHTNGHTKGTSTGFLSFNPHPPRIYITLEDDEFDEVTLQHWREEGFEVNYHAMGYGGGTAFMQQVKHGHPQ
jgi:hypothetical protein